MVRSGQFDLALGLPRVFVISSCGHLCTYHARLLIHQWVMAREEVEEGGGAELERSLISSKN